MFFGASLSSSIQRRVTGKVVVVMVVGVCAMMMGDVLRPECSSDGSTGSATRKRFVDRVAVGAIVTAMMMMLGESPVPLTGL